MTHRGVIAFLPALKYLMLSLEGLDEVKLPTAGAPFYSKLEKLGGRLAARPAMMFLGLGLVVLLTRGGFAALLACAKAGDLR